jgi:hypothetical protein
MVYVAPPGVASDEALHGWIERGVQFVQQNPKQPTRKRAPATRRRASP